MRRSAVETVMAVVVVVGAIAFVVYALEISGIRKQGRMVTLFAQFNQVDGLRLGDPVRISGYRIGQVASISLDPIDFKVDVGLRVADRYMIYEDSFAAVFTDGLFGGKYVQIDPGGGVDAVLRLGDFIPITQDSILRDELLQKVVAFARDRARQAAEAVVAVSTTSTAADETAAAIERDENPDKGEGAGSGSQNSDRLGGSSPLSRP